jgi:hypothetical protein
MVDCHLWNDEWYPVLTVDPWKHEWQEKTVLPQELIERYWNAVQRFRDVCAEIEGHHSKQHPRESVDFSKIETLTAMTTAASTPLGWKAPDPVEISARLEAKKELIARLSPAERELLGISDHETFRLED